MKMSLWQQTAGRGTPPMRGNSAQPDPLATRIPRIEMKTRMRRRISSHVEEMANMGEGRPTGRQRDNLSLRTQRSADQAGASERVAAQRAKISPHGKDHF